jgi:hypothetical protein
MKNSRSVRQTAERPLLRIYREADDGPDFCPQAGAAELPGSPQPAVVPIRLRELLRILAAAVKPGYLWVQDFLDDEVRVTPDFYQVLRAFEEMQRLTHEVV